MNRKPPSGTSTTSRPIVGGNSSRNLPGNTPSSHVLRRQEQGHTDNHIARETSFSKRNSLVNSARGDTPILSASHGTPISPLQNGGTITKKTGPRHVNPYPPTAHHVPRNNSSGNHVTNGVSNDYSSESDEQEYPHRQSSSRHGNSRGMTNGVRHARLTSLDSKHRSLSSPPSGKVQQLASLNQKLKNKGYVFILDY